MTDLRARLVSSSIWMLANSSATRALSFATQIIVAYLLTKADFGIYAAAISVSAVLTALRGGGMPQWLIQGGDKAFQDRAGPAFWLSLTINVLIALALTAGAYPIGELYGDSRIALILLVTGASFPLITAESYFKSLLSVHLELRTVALIELLGGVLRYSLTVWFAMVGLGPLSFVAPLPLVYIVEGTLGYIATRDRPWKRSAKVRTWGALVGQAKWIMLGSLVVTLSLQVDYILLAGLIPFATLGVYFFAFQLTYMTASLITENARRVLFPGLVAVPPSRRADAALRATSLATLVGGPPLLLLGVIIDPLEDLIWGGRWEAAVLPVQLLSVALPIQLMTTITQSSMQSDGRFRLWTAVNALRAVIVAAGAVIAGSVDGTSAGTVAATMSGSYALANLLQVGVSYRFQGVSYRAVAAHSIGAILAPVAMIATILVVGLLSTGAGYRLVLSTLIFLGIWCIGARILDRPGLDDAWATLATGLRQGAVR